MREVGEARKERKSRRSARLVINSYKLGSFSLLQSLRDSFLVRGSRSLEIPTFGFDSLDKVGACKLVPPSDEGGAEGGRREKAEGLYGFS